MKNTYVVRIFAPGAFSGIGGAEKYAATIAQYLSRNYENLDIKFVSYRHDRKERGGMEFLNAAYELSIPDSVGVIALDEERNRTWGRFLAHRALRQTSRHVDLYINCFHNVHFFHAKKNVHIVHFPAPRRTVGSPTFRGNLLLRPLAAILDRKYKDCYDLFICNSRFTELWLEKYWGISSDRRAILYPPTVGQREWSSKIELDKEPIILIVSRFDPRKNIVEMVRFFAESERQFPGWRLVVAGALGEGDEAYAERICEAAKGHRIDILPNVSANQRNELYRKASIFWHAMGMKADENTHPVDVEHFGISTVEAMAAGAVPVVIDKGGQREIVDAGENGFRWSSFRELETMTQKLMADAELRVAMSKKAIETSRKYSLEAFYMSIDSIFAKNNLIPMRFRRSAVGYDKISE